MSGTDDSPDEVEARVLEALQEKLLRQDLFEESATSSHAR